MALSPLEQKMEYEQNLQNLLVYGRELLGLKQKLVHCDSCDKTFNSFQDFDSHIPVATRSKPHLVCEYCKRRYAMPEQMQVILRCYKKRKVEHSFTCSDCKVKPVMCKEQDIIQDCQETIDVHPCSSSGECKLCVKIYRRKANIQVHQKKVSVWEQKVQYEEHLLAYGRELLGLN